MCNILLPTSPEFFEDVFQFDESFDSLNESKYIGAHPEHRLEFSNSRRHSAAYAERRKVGHTLGARKLSSVKSRVKESLLDQIDRFQFGELSEGNFRKSVTSMMRESWRDAFQAGARSAGVGGKGTGRGKFKMRLTEVDDVFLKRAAAHEMRYLNGMIEDVVEGTYKMPLEKRVEMYVESLRSFYDNARVIGLPRATIIHWQSEHDHKVCAGCKYLYEHSPYTKYTLPCVPRSGKCDCRTNCRCYLRCVRSTPKQSRIVESDSQFTREQHLRNLSKLFK